MIFDLNTIYSHSLSATKLYPDTKEILRYMGHRGEAPTEIMQLVDKFSKDTLSKASPKGAFVIRKIYVQKDSVKIGDKVFFSTSPCKNLCDCTEAVLSVLTMGADSERAILSKKSVSPLEALTVSSLFTEALEKYADAFTDELKSTFEAEGNFLRPRFSPGYGDFLIENQTYFIAETDAGRRCGVSVTDSFILTPSKTITGIIGIGSNKSKEKASPCQSCSIEDCEFTKTDEEQKL